MGGRTRHRGLAALVGTTVLFFLVLISIAGTSMLVFRSIQGNVDSISQQAGELLAPNSALRHAAHRLAGWVGLGNVDFAQVARDQVRQLGGFLAGSTVGIVSGLGGALLQAAVALFTLYYLLEDGPELLRGITRFVPLDEELTLLEVTRRVLDPRIPAKEAQAQTGRLRTSACLLQRSYSGPPRGEKVDA